jgi:hypothetical protein
MRGRRGEGDDGNWELGIRNWEQDMDTPRSVEEVEGAWEDSRFASGLIERCRGNWAVPVMQLSNQMLATFIRQKIALSLVVPEGKRRIAEKIDDGSEFFDGELAEAIAREKGKDK